MGNTWENIQPPFFVLEGHLFEKHNFFGGGVEFCWLATPVAEFQLDYSTNQLEQTIANGRDHPLYIRYWRQFHPVVNGILTPEVASKNHEIKTDPYGQLRSNTELHMDIT